MKQSEQCSNKNVTNPSTEYKFHFLVAYRKHVREYTQYIDNLLEFAVTSANRLAKDQGKREPNDQAKRLPNDQGGNGNNTPIVLILFFFCE
jgi:hypothetical protein